MLTTLPYLYICIKKVIDCFIYNVFFKNGPRYDHVQLDKRHCVLYYTIHIHLCAHLNPPTWKLSMHTSLFTYQICDNTRSKENGGTLSDNAYMDVNYRRNPQKRTYCSHSHNTFLRKFLPITIFVSFHYHNRVTTFLFLSVLNLDGQISDTAIKRFPARRTTYSSHCWEKAC